MALINKLSAIGEAIREKTGKEDLLTLDEMPAEIKSIESGSGDNWYDTFWDTFQQSGERADYNSAFYAYCSPTCWTSELICPKYDLKGTNFANCFRGVTGELDLSERLKELNVTLDTSQATTIISMYRGSHFTTVPIVDFSNCTTNTGGNTEGAYYMFAGCSKLHTIEKIITKRGITYTNTFQNCTSLKNIKFEGEIDQSIGFPGSAYLTVETVQSIIDCLVKYEGTENPPVLTFGPSVKKRMTDAQIATITNEKNWTLA